MTTTERFPRSTCAWLTGLIWLAACTTSPPPEGAGTESGSGSSSTSDTTGGESTGVLPTATAEDSGSTRGDSTGEELSSSSDASSGGSTTGGPLASTVVFVNFEGGVFFGGGYMGTMAPYPVEAGRDEILERMRNHYAAFDVSIVDQPPAEGLYTTAVIGVPDRPLLPIEGTGPLDCGNAIPDLTVFAFYADQSPARLAAIASSALAVSFGVGHHQDGTDLAASDPSDDAEFLDTCITPTAGPECTPQSDACADDTQQNSYQELLLTLGPA